METTNLVQFVIVCAVFVGLAYWLPAMCDYMLRKHNMKVLGQELAPLGFLLFAGAGVYEQEWRLVVYGVAALAAYLLGLWRLKRRGT